MAPSSISSCSMEVRRDWPSADDAEAYRGAVRRQHHALRVFHGVALQAADLDGQLVVAMEHAGAFAEHVHGTHAGATEAEDVGIENGLRAASQIAGRQLFDEARHVDV